MGAIRTYLDATMCLLWIVTYTLVLIGTLKYKYPLISSATQAVIAPFEFVVWLGLLLGSGFSLDYVFIAYSYWTIIEIAIIFAVLRYKNVALKNKVLYILLICIMTCVMYYLVIVKRQRFFYSYFNTFVGEIFWFIYIFKKKYPMNSITLAIFVAKFIGDAVSIPVYFGKGGLIISSMSVLLPLLDLLFIVVFIIRVRNKHRDYGRDVDNCDA